MNQEEINKQIFGRLDRLESKVFKGGGREKIRSPKDDLKEYRGATGGLRFLISKGFFDKKRAFSEIKKELSLKNYNYSDQAIQTPLNNLSKPSGPLVGFKESGHKVYAKRK